MRPYQLLIGIYFCFFNAFFLYAQPGYQGKRFFVEGNIQTMLTKGPTPNNHGIEFNYENYLYNGAKNSIAFNLNYKFNIGYVISRSLALSFSYQFAPTGFHTQYIAESLIYLNEEDIHSIFYKGNASFYGLNVELFNKVKKGNLAPMGGYFTLGAGMLIGKGKVVDYLVEYNQYYSHLTPIPYSDKIADLNIDDNKFSAFGIKIGYNNRRIISNRLNLNIGAESILFPRFIGIGIFGDSSNYREEYLIEAMYRYNRFFFINVNIGFGVLLF
jgi:hypothetical protein